MQKYEQPVNGFSITDSAAMVTLYSDKALKCYSGKAVKHHSITVTALYNDKVLKYHSGKAVTYYNINAPPG